MRHWFWLFVAVLATGCGKLSSTGIDLSKGGSSPPTSEASVVQATQPKEGPTGKTPDTRQLAEAPPIKDVMRFDLKSLFRARWLEKTGKTQEDRNQYNVEINQFYNAHQWSSNGGKPIQAVARIARAEPDRRPNAGGGTVYKMEWTDTKEGQGSVTVVLPFKMAPKTSKEDSKRLTDAVGKDNIYVTIRGVGTVTPNVKGSPHLEIWNAQIIAYEVEPRAENK